MAQSSVAPHTTTEAQLKSLQESDDATLQHLYSSNYYKVENYVLNNNGTAEQAKDIFQEAFIAVWRNIQLGKFQVQQNASIEAYLFQVAKNKWLDYLRSGHFTKVISLDKSNVSEPVTASVNSEENEYLVAIRRHFKNLGDSCKKILTLFYYEDESMKEIAEKMGWTEATAKNNKYRCIQKLKELVNKSL